MKRTRWVDTLGVPVCPPCSASETNDTLLLFPKGPGGQAAIPNLTGIFCGLLC